MNARPAIFVDRDGVINRKKPEGEYVKSWDEFEFLPGAIGALRRFARAGYLVFVISNQRGVARGIMTDEDLREINERMVNEVNASYDGVTAVYCCTHDNDLGCDCRKPRPGLILKAIKECRAGGCDVDMDKSFVVGDSESDIEAGRALSLRTIGVGPHAELADVHLESLKEAADYILSGNACGSPSGG